MERLKLDIQRFATSGRIQTPANEDGSYFFLMWNISSQSIENNTSTIYWVLYINAAYNYYTNAVSTGAVVINGQTVHSGGTYSNINSGERAITAGRTTIPHNSDGTKSFSVSISGWTLGCSWVSKTQSFTLKTIPRASRVDTFTLKDSQDRANIEGTFNVEYTRFAPQFRDNLVLEYSITPNDENSWTDLKTIENYVSGTDFTLTSAEINILYTATANKEGAVSLRVYMKTYNGETFIGDGAKGGLWAFVLDADPVFTNFAFEDINPTTLALTNDYHTNIKGYSNISIGVSQQDRATALKGASITSYIINDTYTLTKQEFETNGFTINNCETGAFKVVARDSRGKTKDVTKYATQNIQYNPISLSERDSKIERNNNNVGTSAILTLSGTIWKGNFGAVNNAIDSSNTYYELKITDSSGNFVRGATDITPTINNDGTISFENSIKSDNPDYSWNLDDSYYVNVYVKDKLSSSSIQLVLNSAKPNISIDKKGVGINCAYDPDIGGDLQVGGERFDITGFLNRIYPVGSIYMSVNNTSPQTLFGGTWERIKGKFLLSADEDEHWVYIAKEGSSYTFTESATIRYGADTRWITKTVSAGTYTLNTAFFGGTDPAQGTAKTTQILIKTTAGSTSGEYYHKLTVPELASHNHLQYVGANSGSWGVRSDFTGDNRCNNYPQGNTGNTGSNASHNNMPPYLAVYMWERTA